MDSKTESQNAANKFSKAYFLCLTNQPSTKKFSAAGRPAGITSTNVTMLGENIYSSQSTTDPFSSSIPQFSPTKIHKLDHDDRSTCTSVSDTDDSYISHSQLKGDKISAKPAPDKKTRGRVKIKMEYINNKLRRYTTFSKRKSGIMKKAYELSTLTGTQVMLLVASETGHVYTFATPKLQPMITSEAGKALIQTCLHQPDSVMGLTSAEYDNRMSANGFEETELGYHVPDEDFKGNMPDPCLIPVTTSAGIPMMPVNNLTHGMIPMQGFAAMPPEMSIMTHGQMVHQQSTQAMSPPHSSPPPSYSPPGQPASPHRANTYVTAANAYPSSPPSASPYSGPSSHITASHHQQVMMEEMGYDQRSPSDSPSGHQPQHRYSHSPQGLYPSSNASPSTMARM